MTGSSGISEEPSPNVSFSDALKVWLRIAALSFGGPAAQIAVTHKIVVEEKKWIDERRFAHALNFCMLLPGPEAQQLVTYLGWMLHGVRGGLTSGSLFVLPGFVSLFVLGILYVAFEQTLFLQSLLFGLKAAVVSLIASAVVRIGTRVLKNFVMFGIAIGAFVALFVFAIPFPLVIFTAALVGTVGTWLAPKQFIVVKGHEAKGTIESSEQTARVQVSWRNSLLTFLCFGGAWVLPIGLCYAFLGRDHILTQQGVFFSQAAIVTFGGAYAVLPFVQQQVVEKFGWLTPTQMSAGLGMAETTPGPLIQIVQFVAFVGAFHHPGDWNPWVIACVAGTLATWVTYAPCFLWIFLGAPFIETLRHVRWLSGALSAITAAVVGVMLNLAIRFGYQTIFGQTLHDATGRLLMTIPSLNTFSLPALLIALGAGFAMIRWKRGVGETLLWSVIAGIVVTLIGLAPIQK